MNICQVYILKVFFEEEINTNVYLVIQKWISRKYLSGIVIHNSLISGPNFWLEGLSLPGSLPRNGGYAAGWQPVPLNSIFS